MSFICPICRLPLSRCGNSYLCENKHTFDISRSGYVNLLPASRAHSKAPGDSKEMVISRREFLNKGYYEPLKNALALKASELKASMYFDAGCGTGYYTSAVIDVLECPCIGVDISKFAAEASAKSEKRGLFAVASVYDLPIADSSVDLITNVFSPMADGEYKRILKIGGNMLYAVPAPRHLFSLKEILYAEPYENPVSFPEYDGFKEIERIECSFDMQLNSSEDIQNLFAMTPYFWRTPFEASEKLKTLETLKTQAQFYIAVLRRVK